jgi:TrmH family RNA methyltransferase
VELITSPSNPLVKQARALRQHKARAGTGRFLVEGIHHVGEALEAGWAVETLLYAPDLLSGTFANQLIERAGNLPLRLQPVSARVMESAAGKDNPQGILAILPQRDIGLDDLRAAQRTIALVSPQDPGNVGTILRTLDAVGGDALFLLDGGVDLYHPTVVRASMGALFWKPVVRCAFDEFAQYASARGVQMIATSTHADLDYHACVPRPPWTLLMGSEQKGLSDDHVRACETAVRMPMRGRTSSLNLAVAAGVLLYQYVFET